MQLIISPEHRTKYFLEKQKSGVVYKITNLLDNKFYIGSSANLIKRYYTHISNIRANKQTCTKLIRAVRKHKEENFKFEIVEECAIDNLLEREQYFLDTLKPHYNIALIAGSNLGIKRSKEVKLNKSVSQKEKWQDVDYRKEHLENLSKNWKLGANHKNAKLTDADVIKIKKELKKGLLPKQVADNLNLSYYSIKDIYRGKTWKHIVI
jgi:group I intron endonuclease